MTQYSQLEDRIATDQKHERLMKILQEDKHTNKNKVEVMIQKSK